MADPCKKDHAGPCFPDPSMCADILRSEPDPADRLTERIGSDDPLLYSPNSDLSPWADEPERCGRRHCKVPLAGHSVIKVTDGVLSEDGEFEPLNTETYHDACVHIEMG